MTLVSRIKRLLSGRRLVETQSNAFDSKSQINEAVPRKELAERFEAYQLALDTNDIEKLNALFWNSEFASRFGPTESLYGHANIAAFRKSRDPSDAVRRALTKTSIVTFGDAFGLTACEFKPSDSDEIGRQTQVWIKTPDGWRIASAHVSFVKAKSGA